MQQHTNQLMLKEIKQIILSKLEEQLKDIFDNEVDDYLAENCNSYSEDWGDVYKDSDVEKAAKITKEEMINIINNL